MTGKNKMHQTKIALPEAMMLKLKKIAHDESQSLAAVIRRILAMSKELK